MAVKKIIRMGNPILREKAVELTKEEILSTETKSLIKDMYDTMISAEGIGLAAPQIGVKKQIAIIGTPGETERYENIEDIPTMIIINPKISTLDKTPLGNWEGCLSVPYLRGYVERPVEIKLDYLDEKAKQKSMKVSGFHATVVQHEVDHLNGILYIDRVKDTKHISYLDEFVEYHAKKEE